MLDDGSLRSYGGASTVAGAPGGSGADDLVVRSDGASGWLLNGTQIIGFGGQPSTSVSSSAVGFDLSDARNGYAVTAAGQLLAVGSAPARSLSGSGLPSEALGIYFYGSNEFVIKNGGNSGFVTELLACTSNSSDVLPSAPAWTSGLTGCSRSAISRWPRS